MTRIAQAATQLDRAIDSILQDSRGPVTPEEGELVATARLLRRSLPRLHPSFSFEEHVAARLAVARRMELAPAATSVAASAPTPIRPDIEVEPPVEADEGPGQERRRRNLLAGGAIASGVSIARPTAGAAIVAWRRSRSSGGVF